MRTKRSEEQRRKRNGNKDKIEYAKKGGRKTRTGRRELKKERGQVREDDNNAKKRR